MGRGTDSLSDSGSESDTIGMHCLDGDNIWRIWKGKNLLGAFGDDSTELDVESESGEDIAGR
jgi:hypothetical protein